MICQEKVKNTLDTRTKNATKKQSTSKSSSAPAFSTQQAAVNDMMRRALEEDQYSALGSIVDTDSSDDDDDEGYNNHPRRSNIIGKPILNRNTLAVAMKRHMRMEAMNALSNFDGKAFLEDAEEYIERGGRASSSFVVNTTKSPAVLSVNENDEELDVNGRRIGKRRKKKKQNHRRGMGGNNAFVNTPDTGVGGGQGGGGVDDDDVGGGDSGGFDDDSRMVEDAEVSIFGQTAGSSNATWVECDRCKKVRLFSLFLMDGGKCNYHDVSQRFSHHYIVETPTRSS